jgi:hypothetical protein
MGLQRGTSYLPNRLVSESHSEPRGVWAVYQEVHEIEIVRVYETELEALRYINNKLKRNYMVDFWEYGTEFGPPLRETI